ncbi:MBL fold metallo-hydrolase [Synechococcales cyanobacterium C]|uniref:MBL fold metallo-hydrolase n=1 Tax=Petrachloros mirabilis ULC683 TaxID=2781853 RepID=A0A8K1ZYS2_9CYAN|nr:MBL fold metallo-hydrolase [Petrachloros mirabilis ULC683]
MELECLPFGAGQRGEGVCLRLQIGPCSILLDCGLHDVTSLKQVAVSSQSAWPVDLVFCSHAHPDHARGLLPLSQAFPGLPIYASEMTTHLLPLNWATSNWPDTSWCQALPWRVPLEFQDGLTVELFPAGHLPGAAAFLITYTSAEVGSKPVSLLYTGDFFLSNGRLAEGLPLAELRGLAPDVLIVEGSYGTARFPHRRQQENQLAEQILQSIQQGFNVMLPVPVLGVGQEILVLLRSHHLFTGQDLDIWVEPAIAAGCDAYLEVLPHLPATVQNFARHQPLFWDTRVRPRVRRLETDPTLNIAQTPCIALVEETTQVDQYCQPGRPWLLLLPQHPPHPMVASSSPTDSQPISLTQNLDLTVAYLQKLLHSGKLTYDTYLLAEHSDGPGTTQLIHNLRPQHVIFVHGSPTYLADLTSLDELSNRYHLHSPAAGTCLELPLGETLLQPPPTSMDATYEGELFEAETGVAVTLPNRITADPRWMRFADTGLVEAIWQGEMLVLRGRSQRELLMGAARQITPANGDCCATCLHYRGGRCWNSDSALFEFKVAPEGYCPGFTA